MPVPQENLLFVEQASCLFLRMVQDVRLTAFDMRAIARAQRRKINF
ncbi:hypothetical protein QUB37_25915 [Microcoleus sp. AT3-A2]